MTKLYIKPGVIYIIEVGWCVFCWVKKKKEDMQDMQQFIFARLMILIRKPFLL